MSLLGAAVVEIRGNLAPLNAVLDQARARAAGFSQTADQHLARTNAALAGVRQASNDAGSAFQRLVADAQRAGSSLQAALDRDLGIDRAAMSAKKSADVFEAEMARLETVARQKGKQASDAFWAGFDKRVGGSQPSAVASGATYGELEKLAREQERQQAEASQAFFNRTLGIGRQAPSARASASAFEEIAKASEDAAKRMEAASATAARGWQYFSTQGLRDLQNQSASERLGALSRGAERSAQAAKLAGHQWQNLSFQLNDAATMAMSGSGAFQILATQAGQVVQVLQATPGGLKGGVHALIAQASALLTPARILGGGAIGVGLAGAASIAFDYFDQAERSAKRTDRALEEHKRIVASLKEAWSGAARGPLDYAAESAKVLLLRAKINESEVRRQMNEEAARLLKAPSGRDATTGLANTLGPDALDESGRAYYSMFNDYTAFLKPLDRFNESVKAGRPDAQRLLEDINAILEANPNDTRMATAAAAVINLTSKLVELQRMAPASKNAVDQAAGSFIGTRGFENFLADKRDAYRDSKEADEVNRAAEAYRNSMRAISARTVEQRAAIAADQARSEALRNHEGAIAAETAATRARSLVQAEAVREAADYAASYNEDVRARVYAAVREVQSLGMTATENERLRIVMDRTNEARQRAFQLTGDYNNVSAATIEAINREASALAKLGEERRQANLVQDLKFERQQLGRSDGEQNVYSRMNSAGLLDENGRIAGVQNEMIANQIRFNEALEKTQSAAKGLGRDLLEASEKGDLKGLLGNVTGRAKNLVYDRLGQMFDDQVSSMISNAFDDGPLGDLFAKGAGPLGSSASNPMFVSVVGASGALPFAAAGGDVSRSPLPALGANDNGVNARVAQAWDAYDPQAAAKAIQAIESGGNYGALGPMTRAGDRAYGAYQVMGANVPSWTERHFGQRLTPDQFLSNRQAQDAVFHGEFGRLAGKYGPEGASRAWFAGEGGMNRMAAQDVVGTNVGGYGSRFGRLYSQYASQSAATPLSQTATAQLQQSLSGITQASQQAASALPGMAQQAGAAASGLGGLGQQATGLGGIFQSLFSGLGGQGGAGGGGLSFLSMLGLPGFDTGGYTGPGGVKQPAGIVHAGEYVLNAASVRAMGGPGGVENVIRRPQAVIAPMIAPQVAAVASKPNIAIHNYGGAQVEARESTDERGQPRIDIVVDKAVNRAQTTPGSTSSRGLRQAFGVQRQVTRR